MVIGATRYALVMPADERLIRVAAVVFGDAEGRVLTVRKRGTQRFMLPGGKPEPGEEFIDTAVREVDEELGLRIAVADLDVLGRFASDAANEPGHRLESHVFTYRGVLTQVPAVAAEIDELRWFSERELREPAPDVRLAPMLQFDAAPAIFGA